MLRIAGYVFLFLVGLGFAASMAELTLRHLPVSMGLYRTHQHDLWPLHGYGKAQQFTYSTTWQMHHPRSGITNNYGQIAPFDYAAGSNPIVVIGDSFIESQMNHYGDTLQGELGRLIAGKVPVYGFGFAGNSLAEYLSLATLTRQEFSPIAMVFLIIDNDVKESWTNRLGHRYFDVDAHGVQEKYLPLSDVTTAQRIRQLFGDSALYRYIQANLGFSIDRVISKRTFTSPESKNSNTKEFERKSRQVVDYFLAKLPEASGLGKDRLILIFDTDRYRIYDRSHPPRKSVDSAAIQTYFREEAGRLGYSIIEVHEIYVEHYREHQRRFDYYPVDPHWNGLGHRLIAEEVHRRLCDGSDIKAPSKNNNISCNLIWR